MKKRYKTAKKSTSYKVKPSILYSCYALIVNGREIAWGDEPTMKSKLETLIRVNKTNHKRSIK